MRIHLTTTSHPFFCLTLLLAMTFSASSPFFAWAAANPEKADNHAQQALQLAPVTVTAQKQEENLQDVPISLTVLDGTAVEDAKIESVRELADFIPNLFIYESGSGTYPPTMRGISAPVESMQVSTGLFVDGAPILSPTGYLTGMEDIERIEVLRGPQGTLYGNGAEAGVINIVTRRPGNEHSGKISTDVGHWLSSEGDDFLFRTSVGLNGPLIKDKLFFSVSGQYEQTDGFIQNIREDEAENNLKNWYGKLKLLFTPTDDLDLELSIFRLQNKDDGGKLLFSKMGFAAYGLPYPGDRKVASELSDQHYDTTEDLQTLKINYNITDEWSVTSITANWSSHPEFLMDYDFSPYELQHNHGDYRFTRLSEEMRASYVKDKLKWISGIYLDTEKNDTEKRTDSAYPSMRSSSDREITGQTYAVFTNLTYPLTDKLSVVAGLRYETTKKDYNDNDTGTDLDDSWESITPKIALTYALSPSVTLYGSVAQGYRSGGFNATATEAKYYSYDSETLWSYEVGAKTSFLNNALTFNAALFYMDIDDMQVTETLTSGFSYLTNAAKASSKGVELDATWRPLQGLTLLAGFGYTNIEFDDFSDASGDYAGNKNPWAPEYTYNIGVQYRHPSGWYARTDLIGYGEIFFDKANQYSVDPYQIVNAKIGYEWEHFDIYLYGKNIFDKKYDYEGAYSGYFTVLSNPGQVGLQLTARF